MFNDMLDVQIICEIAKHNSFAAAARALRQPPATISRRVSNMERKSKIRFFERTTRSVKTTPQGELVLGHAQRILEENFAVQASLEAMQDKPSGKIRISASVILGGALLGGIAQEFLEQYPECQAFIDITNRKVNLIEEQYDLAIRIGAPGDLDLTIRKLGVVEAGLYLSSSSKSQEHLFDISSPAELENANIILFRGNDQKIDRMTLFHNNLKNETIPIKSQLISNNPMVIMQAGEANESLMVIPRMLVGEKLKKGILKPILPEWSTDQIDVYAVMTSAKLMRPAVRAFLDVAVSNLPQKLI